MVPAVGIVLQARFGSTRLPGKALARIGDVSILERCLTRLTLANAGQVVLATTKAPEDDALAAVARGMRIRVHRGSTDDVLGRYLEAALVFGFDVVVRATGDNPAVDIDAPARVLAALHASSADYACEDGLPLGAGVEAFGVTALSRAAATSPAAEDREHVTLCMKREPSRYRLVRRAAPEMLCRPDVCVTVDEQEDLDRVRRMFASTSSPEPALIDLISASDRIAREDAA